jgi:hypothetical protein
MAKTNADYQREHRERQARRLVRLEETNEWLIAELEGTRAELADAVAENERLTALACRHPAGAVEGGHCHACGADVD